jgi:hypothetical protein
VFRKLLIGPALLGATCLGGSYYGRDAEQRVAKDPDTVYSAISQLVEGSETRGASLDREDGKRVETDLKLAASDPGKSMSVQLLLDGQPGATADVAFAPDEDGKATLVSVRLHSDHAVLRDKLAGTSQARLAFAPDWLLNITFRPVLRAIAEDIEKEQGFASASGSQSEAQLTPEQQREQQAWQQYQAAQPTTDPNQAARDYLSQSGN